MHPINPIYLSNSRISIVYRRSQGEVAVGTFLNSHIFSREVTRVKLPKQESISAKNVNSLLSIN